MPRRKELKAAAYGVLGSLISRNNDVGGYWGLGKPDLHALRRGELTVEVDLIARRLTPSGEEFLGMVARYSDMFLEQMRGRGLPSAWVVRANLGVTFKVKPAEPGVAA